MRVGLLGVLLTGCVIGNQEIVYDEVTTTPGTSGGEAPPMSEFFRRGGESINPGYGVIPDPSSVPGSDPIVLAGMGRVMCEIDVRGVIGTDTDIGHGTDMVVVVADDLGVVVVDDGEVFVRDPAGGIADSFEVDGEVVAGARSRSGEVALLVEDVDGCAVVVGESSVDLPAGACRWGADLEAVASGLVFTDGARVLQLDARLSLTDLGPGNEVSVDPTTGTMVRGFRGESSLQVTPPKGVTHEVELPGALVDLDVRAGNLVVLTGDDQLVLIDVGSREILESTPYYGRLGMERVQLGQNGTSLLLSSASTLQFYTID